MESYNKETYIAEKLQAIVKLNILNSRMKDFYDIWCLSEQFEFDGMALKNSIIHTFEIRHTNFSEDMLLFLDNFCRDDERIRQWRGFLRKSRITNIPENLEEIIQDLKKFLNPVIASIIDGEEFKKTWKSKQRIWQ